MKTILAVLILSGGLALAEEQPVIPVSVRAQAETAVFTEGKPLLMSLTLTNGLPKALCFVTFSTKPNEWNGETFEIQVSDLYRNKQKRSLYLARPEIHVPTTISGPAAHAIQPGTRFQILLDMSKWKIDGGWTKGKYEVAFRMDRIIVDEKITMSVQSDPVHVVIQ